MHVVQPDAERIEPAEPVETVDGLPVLAEVRALEPVRRVHHPAVQAAAVAATGFVAGAATVVAIRHRAARGKPALPRRRRGGPREEALTVLSTRSFLLDVHLLGREQ